MMSRKAILWPKPPGCNRAPIWTGHGFDIDGTMVDFLPSDTGTEGWNDQLADLLAVETDDRKPFGRASQRQVLREIARWLPEQRVRQIFLEVGCGTGSTLAMLAREFSGSFIIGSDYSPSPLAALAKRVPTVPLVQLDLAKSEFQDETFDAIIALNVLEHM